MVLSDPGQNRVKAFFEYQLSKGVVFEMMQALGDDLAVHADFENDFIIRPTAAAEEAHVCPDILNQFLNADNSLPELFLSFGSSKNRCNSRKRRAAFCQTHGRCHIRNRFSRCIVNNFSESVKRVNRKTGGEKNQQGNAEKCQEQPGFKSF